MTPRSTPSARHPRPGPGMGAQVAALAAEAERQFRDGLWDLAAHDAALARKTAEGLAQALGAEAGTEPLPVMDRLEHLREALAVLALGIARTHGQLAWFLARASTVLAPVLSWRSLPAERRQAFGTVVPGPEALADAEGAVRRLQEALVRTGTAADLQPRPGPAADGLEPDAVA
ncbi:hypothetical protein ACIRVF_20145 [Kitasatospora sp. NPDC101157]|uniref:hypothetical protein n=1 Tax=Kitasatospora sp. NPDC101157 TaxID=3364098 RepID=UPI0037F6693F